MIALGINAFVALYLGVPFAEFGTLVSLLPLAVGILALMLGVIAEHTAFIYEEVKQRPDFVISETLGVSRRYTD